MKRFNKGIKYGREMVKQSLEKLGAGRSVVLDKNSDVICGTDVLAAASELGMRGVKNNGTMTASHLSGVFQESADARAEFYKLIDQAK